MNPYVAPFLKRLEHRYSRDFLDMTYAQWVEENTTLRGKPFTFKRYLFQTAIINDMHPNMDVIKCSQVGLTEVQIRKVLAFLVRNRGTRAIFTLPNEPLMDKVSQSRIQPIVNADSVFNTEADKKSVRSKQIMQFGESFLYITGCSEADATSTSADFVANDEVDLSPQDMLALFNSRLQDSDWKINQRFSTPTFPSYGIDLSFNTSDQRMYLVKCDGCNHWNWPKFNQLFCVIPGLPDYIEKLEDIDDTIIDELRLEDSFICCEKCRRPLDLGRTDNRQWVAKYAGRTHARGYAVSPFSTDRLPISYLVTQLLKYKARGFLRGFKNTVLGEAYADGNERLDESIIKACFSPTGNIPEIGADVPCWVGIDMGQTCYLTMGHAVGATRFHVFLFEAVPWEKLKQRIAELDEKYKIVGGSLDRHPYEPLATEIFQMTKGRIIPIEYRGTADLAIIKDKFGNPSHGQVNKTMHIDDIADDVRKRTVTFSGYSHYQQTIIDHLRDMVRDDSEPDKPPVWKKLTGQDHFFHSLAFLKAGPKARALLREVIQEELRELALVATVQLKKNDLALHGKYLDKPSLGTHNHSGIIGVF